MRHLIVRLREEWQLLDIGIDDATHATRLVGMQYNDSNRSITLTAEHLHMTDQAVAALNLPTQSRWSSL